jgi:beta-glucanase (GH16 family)
MWQVKKDTVIKWYYYDGDEFDTDYLDIDKWIPEYSYSQMNYKFDYLMLPKRLEFQNGICKFTCYKDSGLYTVPAWQLDSNFEKNNFIKLIDKNKVKYHYTAGNVWSKNSYGKGYFEIRFKSTGSYGMWPAFWLYGINMKDEIDFFELKGEREKQIHIDVHCPHGCGSHYKGGSIFPKSFGGWIITTEKLNDGYNVLAGEWQDGYVKWYLNGVGIGYYKGDFGSKEMSLIIGNGPAKNGFGFAPGVNKTSSFPNSLDVDYVRVWHKNLEDNKPVKGKKEKQFSVSNKEEGHAQLKKKIGFMYSKKAFKNDAVTISVLPTAGNKVLISALGKATAFEASFFDESGKELISKKIDTSFSEIELPKLQGKKVRIRIKINGKEINENISFE